jgi:hypothetical protein
MDAAHSDSLWFPRTVPSSYGLANNNREGQSAVRHFHRAHL